MDETTLSTVLLRDTSMTREQLEENLRALDEEPLSAEEEAWIREYGRLVKARKKIPFL